MTPTDEIPFACTLTALAEALHEPLTASRLHAYFVALGDRPIERVIAACDVALRECTRFPSPAELRKLTKQRAAELPFQPQYTTAPWALLEDRTDSAYGKAVAALMRRAITEPSGTKRAALFRSFATEWNEHEHWQPPTVDPKTLAKLPSRGDPWEHMAREAESRGK